MARDSSTVASLLAAHRAELVAFAARRARQGVSAEDVVQQAAVQALTHAGQLRDERSGRAWLFRIVRNLLTEQYRSRVVGLPVSPGEATAPDADDAFACGCVLANMRHLRPEYASILSRVVLEGAAIAEVARELGISANAATVRVHRAREALKQRLRAHCDTESVRACLDCVCNERDCCDPSDERSATQARG